MGRGKRQAALVAIVVLVAGAVVGVALAMTGGPERRGLFVDRDSIGGRCSDSRPADEVSREKPWCTLDRAIAAARSGSTVLVRQGRYPAFAVRGRRSDYVTVKPYRRERVTLTRGIHVEDPDYLRTHRRTLNAAYLRFEGFRIPAQVQIFFGAQHIQLIGNDISRYGVYLRLTRDVLVEGNHIHDLVDKEKGVGADGSEQRRYTARLGGVRDLTIRDNHFEHLTGDAIASYHGVRNLLIEGNEIEDTRFTGEPDNHVDSVQIAGHEYGAYGVTIRDNLIHDNSYGVLFLDGRARDVTIENNTIARIESVAIDLHDTHGAKVLDNTTWDTGWGLRVGSDSRRISVMRNVLDWLRAPSGTLADADYNLVAKRVGLGPGPHDPTGEPEFVDPGKLDYGLRPGSPGADLGAEPRR